MTFELNVAGGAEVLKDMAAPVITKLAHTVASGAGPDAKVKVFTTDRAHASVSVPAEQQAKDGVLTRAFADAGIEISPPKVRVKNKNKAPAKKKARK